MALLTIANSTAVAGNLSLFPLLFSADGKLLFCCVANAVKIFSVKTGEQVVALMGHSDTVTGVVMNPSNPLQVITASLDGTMRIWDYYDGMFLSEISMLYSVVVAAVLFLVKELLGF